MLQEHFRRNCPNATLDHVRQFLDDPRLIAWYIHHDAIMFRSSPAGPLIAHPKLVSLPLGTSMRLDEFWADQAITALEQQVRQVEQRLVRPAARRQRPARAHHHHLRFRQRPAGAWRCVLSDPQKCQPWGL